MGLIRWPVVPDRIPCGGAGQFGPLGGLQQSTKPPVVRPHPNVRVRGWNQAEKVGGGGTVGGLPARNGEGGLPDGALRGNADPHAHAALMSNLRHIPSDF